MARPAFDLEDTLHGVPIKAQQAGYCPITKRRLFFNRRFDRLANVKLTFGTGLTRLSYIVRLGMPNHWHSLVNLTVYLSAFVPWRIDSIICRPRPMGIRPS